MHHERAGRHRDGSLRRAHGAAAGVAEIDLGRVRMAVIGADLARLPARDRDVALADARRESSRRASSRLNSCSACRLNTSIPDLPAERRRASLAAIGAPHDRGRGRRNESATLPRLLLRTGCPHVQACHHLPHHFADCRRVRLRQRLRRRAAHLDGPVRDLLPARRGRCSGSSSSSAKRSYASSHPRAGPDRPHARPRAACGIGRPVKATGRSIKNKSAARRTNTTGQRRFAAS